MRLDLNSELRDFIYENFDGNDFLGFISLEDVRVYWELACKYTREQNNDLTDGYDENIVKYFEAMRGGKLFNFGVKAKRILKRREWVLLLIGFDRCYLSVEQMEEMIGKSIV